MRLLLVRRAWEAWVSSPAIPLETVKIMRTQLKRAIELNPAIHRIALRCWPSWIWLPEMQLDEAAELFKKVLELSPGRQDLVVQLGQPLFRARTS